MDDLQELYSAQDQIRDFISPFTDASTRLNIVKNANLFEVSGLRKGREFHLNILSKKAQLYVSKKKDIVPIGTELCRREFADLDNVARIMQRIIKNKLPEKALLVNSMAVTTEIQQDEKDEANPHRPTTASDLISSKLSKHGDYKTALTFLHGEAGSGKSWALMTAALEQAHRFLTREEGRLDLYIDAQGSNLRSLEEQIARQLDEYGGLLRYNEVVPLARLGIIGIVVDGFDELITPSGYDDTLRDLFKYLRNFKGEGALVASARTSFYYRYDLDRAKVKEKEPLHVCTVEILPWTEPQWRDYCNKNNSPQILDKILTLSQSNDYNKKLLGRPFVVSSVFNILRDDNEINESNILLSAEKALVKRERTEKLLDKDGKEPLLEPKEFDEMLELLASEMWTLRQTSLDVESCKTLVSTLCEDWGKSEQFRRVLTARIDSNALLEPIDKEDRQSPIQFPHETMFNRFLAKYFLGLLRSNSRSTLVTELSYSIISDSFSEQFAEIACSTQGLTSCSDALVSIADFAKTSLKKFSSSDYNCRVNIAKMVFELLKRRGDRDSTPHEFSHLVFQKITSAGTNLEGITFSDCSPDDFDAVNSDWSQVAFVDCSPILHLRSQAGQKFHASLPDVHFLELMNEEGRLVGDYYGPFNCKRRLFPEKRDNGTAIDNVDYNGFVETLIKLLKKSQRYFWFTRLPVDEDDKYWMKLKQDPDWNRAIELLEKHDLVERRIKQKSGVFAELLHVINAQGILEALEHFNKQSTSKNIREFWSEAFKG